MKTLTAAILFAAAAFCADAGAATVHGKLVQRSITTIRPVPNMLLTLRSQAGARSSRIYSDRAGEFWFYNVPRGSYVLEIWRDGIDETRTAMLEACRIEVLDRDVEIDPPLRLHSRPMRSGATPIACSKGLDHLYKGLDKGLDG
jgi:hypothetical protein